MSAESLGSRSEQAQQRVVDRHRGGETTASTAGAAQGYAGLATRALALAIDALVIDGAAALVGVTVGLGLSLLHLPSQVDAIVAVALGALFVLWSIGYFVFFWSTTGQTLGSRAMSIAVVDSGGRGALKPRRALLRFCALCLGAAALLSGILVMLWDPRRRCFHDYVARTTVVYVEDGAA